MPPNRIELVKASGLVSSYKKKYKPKERWDVEVFKDGAYIAPDMFSALTLLDAKVCDFGGTLYITDLYRSWDVQKKARDDFLSRKKKHFVAPPGGSFHNAGRAVDISIKELNFEGEDREEWLQILWDIAVPLGFSPIITIPDIDASEAWHLDFPGDDWRIAYDCLSYVEVAKCAILDIGAWNPRENKDTLESMYIQAQLIRLGKYEICKVDGIVGPKTNKVINDLGLFNCDKKDVIFHLSAM